MDERWRKVPSQGCYRRTVVTAAFPHVQLCITQAMKTQWVLFSTAEVQWFPGMPREKRLLLFKGLPRYPSVESAMAAAKIIYG
jgi:hypothetical protein